MIPLEKQVTSKAISKKMKELGFLQESYCYWYSTAESVVEKTEQVVDRNKYMRLCHLATSSDCSAYTASELKQFFPFDIIEFIQNNLNNLTTELYYEFCNKDNPILNPDFLAKILILVKENELS